MYEFYLCLFDAVKWVHNYIVDAAHVEALKIQDVVRDRVKDSPEAPQYVYHI